MTERLLLIIAVPLLVAGARLDLRHDHDAIPSWPPVPEVNAACNRCRRRRETAFDRAPVGLMSAA